VVSRASTSTLSTTGLSTTTACATTSEPECLEGQGDTSRITSSSAGQFIRGTSGRPVDGRLVALIAVAVAALAAGVLTLYFATSALRSDTARARLTAQGRPVEAVVTSCDAVSSGIGQLVQFYDCYGSYSIAGRAYEALIVGERSQLSPGEVIGAVGTPGPAPLLALPGSIPRSGVDWLPATASGCVTACLGLTSLSLLLRRRRLA